MTKGNQSCCGTWWMYGYDRRICLCCGSTQSRLWYSNGDHTWKDVAFKPQIDFGDGVNSIEFSKIRDLQNLWNSYMAEKESDRLKEAELRGEE